MNVLEEEEALLEAVRAAKAAEQVAQRHRQDGARDLEQAEAEAHEEISAVAAGERPADDARLDELFKAVRARQAITAVRITSYPDSGPEARIVDIAGEAELEGRKRAVVMAEQALAEFSTRHVAELIAARQPITAEVGADAVAAKHAEAMMLRRWEAEAAWYGALLRRAGLEHLTSSIKPNPFYVTAPDGLQFEPQPAPAGTETGPIPVGVL